MAAELVLDQARARQSRPVETYPSTRASRSRTNIPILIRAAIANVLERGSRGTGLHPNKTHVIDSP